MLYFLGNEAPPKHIQMRNCTSLKTWKRLILFSRIINSSHYRPSASVHVTKFIIPLWRPDKDFFCSRMMNPSHYRPSACDKVHHPSLKTPQKKITVSSSAPKTILPQNHSYRESLQRALISYHSYANTPLTKSSARENTSLWFWRISPTFPEPYNPSALCSLSLGCSLSPMAPQPCFLSSIFSQPHIP